MIMVSFCWKINDHGVILLENECSTKKKKKKKICFIDDIHKINDQSCCILSGPPCIEEITSWYQIQHPWGLEISVVPYLLSDHDVYTYWSSLSCRNWTCWTDGRGSFLGQWKKCLIMLEHIKRINQLNVCHYFNSYMSLGWKVHRLTTTAMKYGITTWYYRDILWTAWKTDEGNIK